MNFLPLKILVFCLHSPPLGCYLINSAPIRRASPPQQIEIGVYTQQQIYTHG
ncbi:unnamed protein product [Meloidogyne enterolobii]|uniref:Uncharacterized protein n=1 Tax=Meloidogyne enterolobii TaxID=390850 RepID=A0ACB0YRT1_MELEN